MSIQFYLQTRGKTIDYRFLYEAPSSDSEWWRRYADYTLFEDRTIILERLAGEECKLYLSGIPSNRRDRVNTIIRYTLVAELGKGEVSEKAFQLVRQFLDDCRKTSNNILGSKLDDCLPENYIEDALRYASRDDQKRQDEINQKIISLELIPQSNLGISPQKGIFWGRLDYQDNCNEWLSLAREILEGKPGVTALLNATSEKTLLSLKERLLEKQINNAFILLPDSNKPPQSVKDKEIKSSEDIFRKPLELAEKRLSNLGELRKNWFSSLRTRIYIGVGVLFSAFIFLVFILAR